MNDNDLILLYDMIKDSDTSSLTEEGTKLIERMSIVVEQIKLSHEYRDKLQELNKKLQGCDNNE